MTTKQELYDKYMEILAQKNKLLVDMQNIEQEIGKYQEPTMAQDTLCEVWNSKIEHSFKRYYAFKKNGRLWFFNDGATSKTISSFENVSTWEYYKIIEEPGLP